MIYFPSDMGVVHPMSKDLADERLFFYFRCLNARKKIC